MAQEKGNLSINSENFLPIIKKWLYTDKDIFVRELVSNGCDAVTKFKKNYVKTILEKANNNQTKAAEMLGVQRTYLSRLLVELEIKK